MCNNHSPRKLYFVIALVSYAIVTWSRRCTCVSVIFISKIVSPVRRVSGRGTYIMWHYRRFRYDILLRPVGVKCTVITDGTYLMKLKFDVTQISVSNTRQSSTQCIVYFHTFSHTYFCHTYKHISDSHNHTLDDGYIHLTG